MHNEWRQVTNAVPVGGIGAMYTYRQWFLDQIKFHLDGFQTVSLIGTYPPAPIFILLEFKSLLVIGINYILDVVKGIGFEFRPVQLERKKLVLNIAETGSRSEKL